jgi:hypothetical protein
MPAASIAVLAQALKIASSSSPRASSIAARPAALPCLKNSSTPTCFEFALLRTKEFAFLKIAALFAWPAF